VKKPASRDRNNHELSFTNQPAAYEATKTRCSFMNAALVRMSGKGAISHTAAASATAFATE
jgi:hypothetical protein